MRLNYILSLFVVSLVLPVIASAQKLDPPVLVVKEPTFVRMSEAKVTWAPVEGADSYSVWLDGEEIEVVGNTLYLAGKVGQHTVEIIAKSSDGLEQSLPASATINVRDYGDGTIRKPYLIYDKNDWNLFAQAVTNNQFGNRSFEGEVVALAANIDFGGETIRPVGKNFSTGFRGIFDGRGRTIKNAVLEGKGALGLFISFNGIIKNLKADNITVKSVASKPSEGRCAVISGGEAAGQFYNCIVTNSNVEISGEKAGSFGAAVVSVLKSPSAVIDRCISMNNNVRVGKTHS